MDVRTSQQNKAIHLYCEMLSDELNNGGLDMRLVLKPEIDIPWTKDTVKEYLWKPIQDAMLDKKSTTELDTAEVSRVYDVLNKHLAEKFMVSVPFPSISEFLHDVQA